MALQIKVKRKSANISMLRSFVAYYDRFYAKDGLGISCGGRIWTYLMSAFGSSTRNLERPG